VADPAGLLAVYNARVESRIVVPVQVSRNRARHEPPVDAYLPWCVAGARHSASLLPSQGKDTGGGPAPFPHLPSGAATGRPRC
jgi:hypothetical protein